MLKWGVLHWVVKRIKNRKFVVANLDIVTGHQKIKMYVWETRIYSSWLVQLEK